MKTYSIPLWWMWAQPVLVLILLGIIFSQPYDLWVKVFLSVAFLAASVFNLYSPTKLVIDEQNRLMIHCPLKTTIIPILEITALEQESRTVNLYYSGKKMSLPRTIDNLDNFCSELVKRNPLIKDGIGPMMKMARTPAIMIIVIIAVVLIPIVLLIILLNFPEIAKLL